jgi:hypothetical protein
MDVAYISTLSALAGSVIGGLSSSGMTWLNQIGQARNARLAQAFTRREELYRDFIVASSKAYGEALLKNEPQIPELVALYSMISRMRVLSTPRTVSAADKVMLAIIDTYFTPNRSVRELRDLIKAGSNGIDPLKEFSEAAREEVGISRPA